MKTIKKQILEWVDKDVAKTWKEGEIVLILKPDRSSTQSGFIEVCCWFRPDWVDGFYCYYINPEERVLFAKLTPMCRLPGETVKKSWWQGKVKEFDK